VLKCYLTMGASKWRRNQTHNFRDVYRLRSGPGSP
jgi:hypothetical protein